MIGRNLMRAGIIVIVDQVVMSGANFAAGVFLIHYAAKEDYGVYGVAYSALLLFSSTVDVLFSLQMTFRAPHHPEATRKSFCAALRTAQMIVSFALSAAICVASLASCLLGLVSASNTRMALVVGVGSFLMSRQEYYRSLLYLYNAAHLALVMTLVLVLTWIFVVLVGWKTGIEALNIVVLAALCIGAGIAALVGRFLFPLPRVGGSHAVRAATAEVWTQGSWSLVGSIVSWVQNQSYTWLLAVLIGAVATADVNFAKLFFSPLGLVLMAVNRLGGPGLSTVYAMAGERETVTQGHRLLFAMIVLVVIYYLVILGTHSWIIAATGAKAYQGVGDLILAWGIVTAIQVARGNSTLLLGVLRRNRQMTSMQIVTMLISTVGGLTLIPRFGAMGAMVSIGLGELILTGLMWREVNRAAGAHRRPKCDDIEQKTADR
jgi:O-antigen/teichoic acid export membrane protein